MYELMSYLPGVIFVGLGLYMFNNPEIAIKKEFRSSEVKVAKAKKTGRILCILGTLILIINITETILLRLI